MNPDGLQTGSLTTGGLHTGSDAAAIADHADAARAKAFRHDSVDERLAEHDRFRQDLHGAGGLRVHNNLIEQVDPLSGRGRRDGTEHVFDVFEDGTFKQYSIKATQVA